MMKAWIPILLLSCFAPLAAQAHSAQNADDVARLCGLVERTPWGFEALESPPAIEAFTVIRNEPRRVAPRSWPFGCMGQHPNALREL